MVNTEYNKVEVTVKINNTPCHYSDMRLTQTMYGHHTFELKVNYNSSQANVWTITVEEILQVLGQRVAIHMQETQSEEKTSFYGVVTYAEIQGRDGDNGIVVLRGGSPTLLLEGDPSLDSFTDHSLDAIVKTVLSESGAVMDSKIEPRCGRVTLPYICRYKETSFGFIRRLCNSCGEWCFYDGKQLVVGFTPNINTEKSQRLEYNIDFSTVNAYASLGNFDMTQYDYSADDDTEHVEVSYMEKGKHSTYMKVAKEKSAPIYKTRTIVSNPMPMNFSSRTIIEQSAKMAHSRRYSGSSVFEARSATCRIRLGELILTVLPKNMKDMFRDMGYYRVIEITHAFDEHGQYYNVFKGMTASTVGMPLGDIVEPIAYPELATVVENNDPKNLGRVKVQFIWQREGIHEKSGLTTGWMRVQTPDAGSSEKVATNRGFFFVPEVGDQVMVGFEQGCPERPFVMGSMFHSNNTDGVATENAIKSIQTRSGIKIVLNDTEKSVHIEDPSGNTWNMDGNGNIAVNAPETMTFSAKNININAGEDIQISSVGNTSQTAGKDFNQSVSGALQISVDKTLDLIVAEKTNIDMGDSFCQNISGDMKQNAETIEIAAQKGEMKVNAKGELTMKSSSKVTIAQ